MISIVCLSRIANNAIQTGAKNLGIDVQEDVCIHAHVFQTRECQQLTFLGMQFACGKRELPKSCCQTRWLSLLPSLNLIISKWPALRTYFITTTKTRTTMSNWTWTTRGIKSGERTKKVGPIGTSHGKNWKPRIRNTNRHSKYSTYFCRHF